MRYKRGHFIVIEGTDGSGKATQAKLLRHRLQILNIAHQVIDFPRYSGNPYGRLVADYLNGQFGSLSGEVGAYLLSLAYAGDRFLAKDMIIDWLRKGKIVIADRYVPSNKVFMSAKLPDEHRQNFIEWLDNLEYDINGIPREELVILLYAPIEISQANISKRPVREYSRGKVDLHESDLKYQVECAKVYLQLAKSEPNWLVIKCADATGQMRDKQSINDEIFGQLQERGII